MSTIKIAHDHWSEYLDHLSNITDSQLVKIELVGLSLGDQTEIDYADFKGITYDHKDNIISVLAGDLGHQIQQPKEVFVEESDDGLVSMQIVDKDDNQHILYFKTKA
jgi:hypothetical protein